MSGWNKLFREMRGEMAGGIFGKKQKRPLFKGLLRIEIGGIGVCWSVIYGTKEQLERIFLIYYSENYICESCTIFQKSFFS